MATGFHRTTDGLVLLVLLLLNLHTKRNNVCTLKTPMDKDRNTKRSLFNVFIETVIFVLFEELVTKCAS